MRRIYESRDKYSILIERERQNISDLEAEVASAEEELFKAQKVTGGVNAQQENIHLLQKQIKFLENHAGKATKRFNETIAQNKELRETIDELKKQPSIYCKKKRQAYCSETWAD